MRTSAALAAVALAAALAACSGPRSNFAGDPRYGKTAEEDYKSGVDDLESSNYPQAVKFFEHVRNKYPFSKYAALSELRLADAKFEQDRFAEAADAYRQFVKLHPTHEQADYAAFRVGLSYWKDGPSDFFLFPPAYEKDAVQVRDAVKALEAFVKDYPESKYAPEAKKLLEQGQGRLAEHEWYAAEFYAKRKRWAGAAGRLEGLVKNYPGSPREPEALLRLADVYLKLDETYKAQQALQQLIVKHPDDPRRPEAEKRLASLR